jgi:hypothetical protein
VTSKIVGALIGEKWHQFRRCCRGQRWR